jgi:serine O-acetyltransferase
MTDFLPSKESFMEYLKLVLTPYVSDAWECSRFQDALDESLKNTIRRFSYCRNRYYKNTEGTSTTIRSWHYSSLTLILHEISIQCKMRGLDDAAERLYFCNITTTSCDIYHQVQLPIRSYCDHALGSVIGRGTFSERASLQFTNSCTIGNNRGTFPDIDGNLIMMPCSALLGSTTIVGNVIMARGAQLRDAGEVRNCLVFGQPPSNHFKPLTGDEFSELSAIDTD